MLVPPLLRPARFIGLSLDALVAVALSACSLAFDAGQTQCSTDVDCTSRGGAFSRSRCVNTVCVAAPPDAGRDSSSTHDAHATDSAKDGSDGGVADAGAFACLGNNPFPTAKGPSATFTLSLSDFFTAAPINTVSVKACVNSTDPSCAIPLETRTPDDAGVVTFTLDTSNGPFTGYFKVDPTLADGGTRGDASSPDAALPPSSYVPARIYYSDDPIASNFSDSWGLFTVSLESTLTSLFNLAPVDNADGIVLVTVYGCGPTQAASLAAGVSVSVDTSNTQTGGFYIANGMPSATATATDSSGIAGFVNVTPGVRTFTFTQVSTNEVVSTFSAYVFPGVVTYANINPQYTGHQ